MAVNIDSTQLTMLLDGIDFGRVGRPKHWKPPTPIAK
jgi:transposase